MIVALTARRLKPGTFDDFRDAWSSEEPPEGWTEAYTVRNLQDENEVISFGFFDGTLDELRKSQDAGGYSEFRAKIDAVVESTTVDGLYEVVVEQKA